MRGNVVVAAVVFAVGMVVAAAVGVAGVRWVALDAMGRFERSVREHGGRVEAAGQNAGTPIGRSVQDLSGSMVKLAASVEHAGADVSRPLVKLDGPIAVREPLMIRAGEPLKIRGIEDDGGVPVSATLGKEPEKQQRQRAR